MTRPLKAIADVATRFAMQSLFAFVVSALVTWLTVSWLRGATPTRISVALAVFVISSLGILLLSGVYMIHRENLRFRLCATELHEVNHIYRDTLCRFFSAEMSQTRSAPDSVLMFERSVLNSVCVKIASIFRTLIGRKCVVTVKLLAQGNGKTYCFTWARSDSEIRRGSEATQKFAVGTKENIGFDLALERHPSEPSFFHSGDLLEEPRYTNQRQGWQHLYRSTIVVPIQYTLQGEKGEDIRDVLGFVCVDTLSTHRLNRTYHVQLMAAFADQMYNFMSMMRRKYLFEVATEKKD